MKFGYPVWYGDGSIRKSVETAHNLGFDYIEFSLDYPWPERLSEKDRTLLKNLKKDYNLDIAFHAPWGGIDLCYPRKEMSEASIKIFSDSMKFAAGFAPLYFNFHLMTNIPTWKCADIKKEIYEKVRTVIPQLTAFSERCNIRLALENNHKTLFKDMDEFKPLLSENLRFCFDVGHAARAANDSVNKEIFEWMKTFKKQIITVHLHDASSEIDHLPLGKGTLQIKGILGSIKKTACEYVLIELQERKNFPLSEKDFRSGLDYCKRFL